MKPLDYFAATMFLVLGVASLVSLAFEFWRVAGSS
jgi:hypothetical protein